MGRARAVGLVLGLALAGGLLSGCGFRPLYGTGAPGTISSNLTRIQISPIADRKGQMLRNELVERLTPKGAPRDARWRLDVALNDTRENVGILKDESVTRVNLRMVATYALVDLASNKPVMVRTTRSISSYNVPQSEFATVVGQRDAEARAVNEIADEIRTRVAVFLDQLAAGQVSGPDGVSGKALPRADGADKGGLFGDGAEDRGQNAKPAP